jgi:HSP20 family protein
MSPTRIIWLPQGVVSQTMSKQRAGGVQFYSKGKWTPDTDIYEVEDGLVILIDIAGVKKEEIEIVLKGQILSISGLRKEPAVCKKHIHRLEIDFGQFERTFRIPYTINPDKVEARYEEGFLYLWLPKQPEDACIIDITIA